MAEEMDSSLDEVYERSLFFLYSIESDSGILIKTKSRLVDKHDPCPASFQYTNHVPGAAWIIYPPISCFGLSFLLFLFYVNYTVPMSFRFVPSILLTES